MEKIEWPRSKILEFIRDYKTHRLLWDPAVKDYHIKSIKYAALERLSEKYDIEVRAIRCKIKSLRSSFHREHGKVRMSEQRGVLYRPMWFAYDAMKFILEAVEVLDGEAGDNGNQLVAEFESDAGSELKRNHLFSDMITDFGANTRTITADDIKTEILEESDRIEQLDNYLQDSNPIVSPLSKKRRRDDRQQPHAPCKSSKPDRDEYTVFGEYVGMTLRKLNSETSKIVVKHFINNLLFEAEMGKYDNGIPLSRSPPNLYLPQTQSQGEFNK